MYQTNISPYKPTIPSYVQFEAQDQTLRRLKRNYADHESMKSNYKNLHNEICEAEVQKSRLQQKNIEICQEYMNKISKNKKLITKLSSQIEEIEKKIRKSSLKSVSNECENEEIINGIKNTKHKIISIQQQTQVVQNQVQQCQNKINKLSNNLQEINFKNKNSLLKNKKESQTLDQEFGYFKNLQEQAKKGEAQNLSLKKQLSILKSRKMDINRKSELSDTQMQSFKHKLSNTQIQSQQLTIRCRQLQKQSSKLYAQAGVLKQNIGLSLGKNKEHTVKLKNFENILKQSLNSLERNNKTKQKLLVDYSNAIKDVEKVESQIKKINIEIEDQDKTNKELIKNIKRSMVNDQQAVKALTRKVAIISLLSKS